MFLKNAQYSNVDEQNYSTYLRFISSCHQVGKWVFRKAKCLSLRNEAAKLESARYLDGVNIYLLHLVISTDPSKPIESH